MATTDLSAYDSDKTLYLFTSLTAGSSHVVTATARIETILKANKIPYVGVDTATDELARKLWGRRSRGKKLPALVKEGYIVADLQELEDWNEFGEVKQNLGVVASAPTSASAPKPTVQSSNVNASASLSNPQASTSQVSTSSTGRTIPIQQPGADLLARVTQNASLAKEKAANTSLPTKASSQDQLNKAREGKSREEPEKSGESGDLGDLGDLRKDAEATKPVDEAEGLATATESAKQSQEPCDETADLKSTANVSQAEPAVIRTVEEATAIKEADKEDEEDEEEEEEDDDDEEDDDTRDVREDVQDVQDGASKQGGEDRADRERTEDEQADNTSAPAKSAEGDVDKSEQEQKPEVVETQTADTTAAKDEEEASGNTEDEPDQKAEVNEDQSSNTKDRNDEASQPAQSKENDPDSQEGEEPRKGEERGSGAGR